MSDNSGHLQGKHHDVRTLPWVLIITGVFIVVMMALTFDLSDPTERAVFGFLTLSLGIPPVLIGAYWLARFARTTGVSGGEVAPPDRGQSGH